MIGSENEKKGGRPWAWLEEMEWRTKAMDGLKERSGWTQPLARLDERMDPAFAKWPINLYYEDNHVLVVEKPAGLLSQGDVTGDPDLLNLLKTYLKVKYHKPGEAFLGLVHRLDRPVSGLMVFAKTSKGASRLSEQVRTRKIEKEYLAVVHGRVPIEDKARGTEPGEAELGRTASRGTELGGFVPGRPGQWVELRNILSTEKRGGRYDVLEPGVADGQGARQARQDRQNRQPRLDRRDRQDQQDRQAREDRRGRAGGKVRGKEAILNYRVLAYGPEGKDGNLTLLAIRLVTGRSHQIRLQMAHMGHPLVGDRLYGWTKPLDQAAPTVALHAYHLAFFQPVTGEKLSFQVPPPDVLPFSLFAKEGRG